MWGSKISLYFELLTWNKVQPVLANLGRIRSNSFEVRVFDHCTKFVVLQALCTKAAPNVASHLFEILCTFSGPKILHSDKPSKPSQKGTKTSLAWRGSCQWQAKPSSVSRKCRASKWWHHQNVVSLDARQQHQPMGKWPSPGTIQEKHYFELKSRHVTLEMFIR